MTLTVSGRPDNYLAKIRGFSRTEHDQRVAGDGGESRLHARGEFGGSREGGLASYRYSRRARRAVDNAALSLTREHGEIRERSL